jgi:hypothetical protein
MFRSVFDGHPAVLSNPGLLTLADDTLAAGLADSTRQVYNSAWRKFVRWAIAHSGGRFISMLPASEATIALFIIFESTFVGYASIRTALAAIRSMHLEAGFKNPLKNAIMLERVVRSIKRSTPRTSRPIRRPITTYLLSLLKPLLDLEGSHNDRCFWAAATMGVYCLLRAGEFLSSSRRAVVLRSGDFAWATLGRSHAIVHLRVSKTDIFREGVDVHMFRNGSQVCPAQAMEDYMVQSVVVLTNDSSLFRLSDGKTLTRTWMIDRTRLLLRQLSLPASTYSGISFRKGGAMSLHLAGTPAATIKAMGRWRSECYQLYIAQSDMDIFEAGLAMSTVDSYRGRLVFGSFNQDNLFVHT